VREEKSAPTPSARSAAETAPTQSMNLRTNIRLTSIPRRLAQLPQT
jgi:hypothetical protein